MHFSYISLKGLHYDYDGSSRHHGASLHSTFHVVAGTKVIIALPPLYEIFVIKLQPSITGLLFTIAVYHEVLPPSDSLRIHFVHTHDFDWVLALIPLVEVWDSNLKG